MTVFRAPPDFAHWPEVAALIHRSFSYMGPILGHPAQAMAVTPAKLANAARIGTAFVISDADNPVACAFTRPSRDYPDALYLGWLAVDGRYRARGLARALIMAAEAKARADGQCALTLDTGCKLTKLCAMFTRLGFQQQPAKPDLITFRKELT